MNIVTTEYDARIDSEESATLQDFADLIQSAFTLEQLEGER